ncbi:hypothetical protein OCK74_17595 [Chitinophagaceae bacterium LB-8]|uniref:Uncharacterized protein n=1 Tax=Paraflavisolibacter caeni TaxID=2982496 RepID=A0A9X2XWV5_9BACT|nr:hypothetical protein [Paraflavisolibacter caeni]MCU7550939.1 hypothetical protein [Paraflavisolibacter caeni]
MTKILHIIVLQWFFSCLYAQSGSLRPHQSTPVTSNSTLTSDSGLAISRLDPCIEAKAALETVTAFSKTDQYVTALNQIQTAFLNKGKEHVIAFGKDDKNNILTSFLNSGAQSNSTVPNMANAFADLHNHPGNHPPDAGDLYGLIDINQKQKDYNARFVVTQNNTVYALVITNASAANSFNVKYPRDLSGCFGCSPKFPEALVDEFREMKYGHGCTDEMALAFLLEKYNTGISLLKQHANGAFYILRTAISRNGNNFSFTTINCQ